MNNDFFFRIHCMEINAFSQLCNGSSDNGEGNGFLKWVLINPPYFTSFIVNNLLGIPIYCSEG